MRGIVRKSIGVGVAVGLIMVALVTALFVTHRPDEGAYLRYVATYGNYDGKQVHSAVSERDLVAGGQRACDWLGNRPMALWRTDRKWEVNSLYLQYARSLPAADSELPKSFLPGAYTYLCPLSTYVHKPHRLLPNHDTD